MQTPNLPIQVNSAGPAPQAARAKNGSPDSGGQFSEALSREMDNRKSPMTPPAAPQAASKAPAPAKAPQAPQQAKAADKAPETKGAPSAKPSEKTDVAEKAVDDSAAAAAAASSETAQAAAATPVADMLALVASFNQPAAAVAADPAAAVADPLLAAGGKRARLELPVDGAPMPLPAAARAIVAGQALTAVAPGLAGKEAPAVPQGAFTNMMARADASALDAVKSLAQPALDNAAPVLQQAGAERAAPVRAGAEAPVALPDQLKPVADALPNASLRARDVAAEASAVKDLPAAGPAVAPLQQSALSVAHAVNGLAAGDKIPARVGTPAWDNQVAQKIVWMVGGEEQSASLTLNPPDLGPMQVVLSVTNDMASVTFSSNQMEVRQALEDAMPKLREMMSENGIALGNATVNDGAAQQQQEGDGKSGSHGGGAQRVAEGTVTNGSAAEAEARNNARPARVGQSVGMVDTFA